MEGRAHVAPDGEALDAADVGLLDPGTIGTAPSSGRVVLRLAAFGAVAAASLVGLGLTMLRSSPAVEGKLPKGLILKQDFRLLHDDNFIKYDPKKTIESNIEAAYDHFMGSSGFARELTDDEEAAYKANFIDLMGRMSKDHDRGSKVDAEQWQSWLKNATEDEKPAITDAFVDRINSQNLGFRVAKLPGTKWMTQRDVRVRLGFKATELPFKESPRRPTGDLLYEFDDYDVPTSFASSDKWPDCREVIRRVHQQGRCGSCWAFAALSVLDSRLCIRTRGHPGGRFNGTLGHLSRTYATSCMHPLKDLSFGPVRYNGCSGGHPADVFEHVAAQGIPTGGDEGCIPYFAYSDGESHFDPNWDRAPPCPRKCKRATYPRALHRDKFFVGGRGASYSPTEIRQIQQMLVTDGPIAVVLPASGIEFKAYVSGILRAGGCDGDAADHAVTAIGYGGDTCGGNPGACSSFYWRLLNSWGAGWGDEGEISVAWCEVSAFFAPGNITSADLHEGLPDPILPEVPGGDGGGLCAPFDNDLCLQRSSHWSSADTCADSVKWCSVWWKDMQRCCSLSCGTDYLSEEACGSHVGLGDCEYPHVGSHCTTQDDVFRIVDGNCKVEEDCVMSPNFPHPYENDDGCTIDITVEQGIELSVLAFNTEFGYDFLIVNGLGYSGDEVEAPSDGHASGTITWTADFSNIGQGWKICHGVESQDE